MCILGRYGSCAGRLDFVLLEHLVDLFRFYFLLFDLYSFYADLGLQLSL